MKTLAIPLALVLAMSAPAAPALAGGISFDLPNLTFPEPRPPVTQQDCASPAAGNEPACVPA